MSSKRGYFNDLGQRLHLDSSERQEIIHELQAHVEDKTLELVAEGATSDEAISHALNDLGPSNGIAQNFYEVHSRGSWFHTTLAVLPHVILAFMFAFHLWTTPGWIVLMFATALAMSVVGWRMGRPRWAFPWLGYCLMAPILSWGLAMSAVGYGAWGVLAHGTLPLGLPIYWVSFAYIALSLAVVIRIVSKVARPDWVMASLAVLPIPFLAYWFLYFYSLGEKVQTAALQVGEVDNYIYSRGDGLPAMGLRLQEIDGSAAIVFLILAVSTALFFRIGRRIARVSLLIVTAPSMIVLAWISYHGDTGYMAAFLFSAVSLAILLSPALFELKDRSAGPPVLPLERASEGYSS